MKKSSKLIVLICIALFTLSSCNFYTPAYINATNYEDVGDINVGGNIGTTADFNVSTNPIKHLSVLANASYSGAINNEDDPFDNREENEFEFSRYQVEAAVGYYYYLGAKAQHDLHVGYGFGRAASYFNSNTSGEEAYAGDISNIFLQSSFIFEIDNDLDAVFTSKLNRVTYNNLEVDFDEQNYIFDPTFDNILDLKKRTYNVAQFGMGFISTIDYLELRIQAQFALSDGSNSGRFDVRPIGAHIGFNVNIDKFFKEENSDPFN